MDTINKIKLKNKEYAIDVLVNNQPISEVINLLRQNMSSGKTYSAGAGISITGANNAISTVYGTTANTACLGNDSRLSDSRPASDVSAWAKLDDKPNYEYYEIGYSSDVRNSTNSSLSLDGRTPIYVITPTQDITSLTLSNNPSEGHSCRVILKGDESYTVTVKYDNTNRICSIGKDLVTTIPNNGYAEIEFLTVGGKVYVRSLIQQVSSGDSTGEGGSGSEGGNSGDDTGNTDNQTIFSVDSTEMTASPASNIREIAVTSLYEGLPVDYDCYLYDGNIESVEKTLSGIKVTLKANYDKDNSVYSHLFLRQENTSNELTISFTQSADAQTERKIYLVPLQLSNIVGFIFKAGHILFSSDGSKDEYVDVDAYALDQASHYEIKYESGKSESESPVYRQMNTSDATTYNYPVNPATNKYYFAYLPTSVPVNGNSGTINFCEKYENVQTVALKNIPVSFTRSFDANTKTWSITFTHEATNSTYTETDIPDNMRINFESNWQ